MADCPLSVAAKTHYSGAGGLYKSVRGRTVALLGHKQEEPASAIGQCHAEMIICGEATTVDISHLRATRFDDEHLRSTYGGNRG